MVHVSVTEVKVDKSTDACVHFIQVFTLLLPSPHDRQSPALRIMGISI